MFPSSPFMSCLHVSLPLLPPPPPPPPPRSSLLLPLLLPLPLFPPSTKKISWCGSSHLPVCAASQTWDHQNCREQDHSRQSVAAAVVVLRPLLWNTAQSVAFVLLSLASFPFFPPSPLPPSLPPYLPPTLQVIYLKHTLELVEPLKDSLAGSENPLIRAYHDVSWAFRKMASVCMKVGC